jgi:hypothetical protein
MPTLFKAQNGSLPVGAPACRSGQLTGVGAVSLYGSTGVPADFPHSTHEP